MKLKISQISFKKDSISFLGKISLVVIGLFVFTLRSFAQSEASSTFLDVSETNPYYVSVSYLKEKGLITGYEDKTFMPEAMINKAESLRVILTAAQIVPDDVFEAVYPDVKEDQWFSSYVIKAHHLGIVKGNDQDGLFRPSGQVKLAEFLKMLLIANNIDVSSVHGTTMVPNIASDAWFADYLNKAVELGFLSLNPEGALDPGALLSRGEVMDMIYLLLVMTQGNDPNFLLDQTKKQLAQIEVYVLANQLTYAKNASQLAVQFTQQAYKINPFDPLIVGDAKIARAYDWLMDSILLGVQKKNEEATQKANEAIDKATEAWQVNHDTQPIAAHIKEKAREVLRQVNGLES